MSKSKSLGLSLLFLAIALLVSGTLVSSLRTSYSANSKSLALSNAIRLLQQT